MLEALRSWRGAVLVQDMSMGLWQGRKFRFYREFTLAGGESSVFRFVCTKPFLLTFQSLYVDDGAARAVISTGGTPSGTWAAVAVGLNPMFRIGMNPVPSNIVETGGTVTGGAEREVLRSDSGAGVGVGFENRLGGIRGLGPGTYYFTITATGTSAGMYSFEFEELDE